MSDVVPSLRMVLAAASAANAAGVDLTQIAKDAVNDFSVDEVATHLGMHEVAENLADALQSVLTVELAIGSDATDYPPTDRREAAGQLLGAVSRFLDGWA